MEVQSANEMQEAEDLLDGISLSQIKRRFRKLLMCFVHQPDDLSVSWPELSLYQGAKLAGILSEYNFVNGDWSPAALRNEQQPEPTPSMRARRRIADGFIFGMIDCAYALCSKKCWGIFIDSLVTPRSVAMPIIEHCIAADVPVVCLPDLKRICLTNYGQPVSCLGIKVKCLPALREIILDLSFKYKAVQVIRKLSLPSKLFKSTNQDTQLGHNRRRKVKRFVPKQ